LATRQQIIDGVVTAIADGTDISRNQIFVVAVPHFVTNGIPSIQYVEVIPGAQSNEQGNVGVGVAHFDFSVCVFTELFTDRLNDSIDRIVNASQSLMNLISALDEALLNQTLGGILSGAIWPTGIDAAQDSPIENDGWVMQRRSYACQFSFDYPPYGGN
jgi:hypothetical protein